MYFDVRVDQRVSAEQTRGPAFSRIRKMIGAWYGCDETLPVMRPGDARSVQYPDAREIQADIITTYLLCVLAQ